MKTYTSFFLILLLSLFAGKAVGQCTVEAGADETICEEGTTNPLGGSIGDGTSALWTSSDGGTFLPLATDLNATWQAPAGVTGPVTLTLTGSGGSCEPTSDTKQVTVNPILDVSVLISAGANPVCAGTSVTFTASPTNGGTPTYQWYKNGTTPIGTGSSLDYEPADGDKITVVMTSSETTCTTGNPATSNEVIMIVNPLLPVSVSITASNNNICTGTAITFTATPVYGGGTPLYQWYESTTPVGTNSPTYTYDPDNGDEITVRLTSSETCTTGNPATSNAIAMTVYSDHPAKPGTIAGKSDVCQGETNVDYSISDVENALSYEWSVGSETTIVSGDGTTSIVVNFSALATSHSIYVISRNTCGDSDNKAKSITVHVPPTATIGEAATVCQNASYPQITIYNPQSNGITVTYNINGANQTTVNVSGNNHTHVNAPTEIAGEFTYSLVSAKYQSGTICENLISGTATISVTPIVGIPTPITISAGSDPACQLTNGTTTTTYTTTAANSTGFNWSLSDGAAGNIGFTTGVMTWADGFSESVNIQVVAIGCGTSSQVIRAVSITPTVGTPTAINISTGSEPICQLPDGSSTTTYTTTATYSTGFNWSLSNSAAGSIGASSGIMTWASGFSGSVDIQVTANGCNDPS
ncbi:MAG: hypothetical protein NTW82_10090, partial [Bacteroidia bacterium]|nr:hypothetical protein [Bacteroidia bacterium]